MTRSWRIFRRICALIGVIIAIRIDYFFTLKLRGKTKSFPDCSVWMRRQSHRFLRALELKVTCRGTPPTEGVIVSNHVSYLDIIVLGGCVPQVFISKAEVARWPIFGPITRWARTLFIRRELRSDVLRVSQEMPLVIESGVPLTFFPEGTSSSGESVLPFRASLLGALVENRWPVTPAFLRYELDADDGSVAEEVAYWKDMVFGPHLLNLLGKRHLRATVTYGTPIVPDADRKTFAVQLRGRVCQLGGLDESPVNG